MLVSELTSASASPILQVLASREAGKKDTWVEVRLEGSRLQEFNQSLLATRVDVRQYPFWNERFRTSYSRPRYLTYRDEAYACIIDIGFPQGRIGLIQFGPATLNGDNLPLEAWEHLHQWARRAGFLFLRVQHWNPDILSEVSYVSGSDDTNSFPFVSAGSEELIVRHTPDENEMLRSFQEIARRDIKAATKYGYTIRSTDDPQALREVWPIFTEQADRKSLRYRSVESYAGLMEHARPDGLARLFVAQTPTGEAVSAILICRDSTHAFYLIGALDVKRMGDAPTPSCLLHWSAMRELGAQGVTEYNLGTRSGPVYVFKKKFRPQERKLSQRTIITAPIRFGLWKTALRTYHWLGNQKLNLLKKPLYSPPANLNSSSAKE